MSGLPKIVVVCGPTAAGKTGLGIRLAEAVDGEIVGADSLQVYRFFNIGSAKPSAEERDRAPHHLIDVRNPDQPFNAALFKKMADEAIGAIHRRGRAALVVGGTGLYLRILIRGIFKAPKPDEGLRERLRAESDAYGVEHLHNRLELVDPTLASKVEPHDKNRIMRGLEIFEQTGIPLSAHQDVHDYGEPSYRALIIGVKHERASLYQRIVRRAEAMFDDGLLDEYAALRRRGFTPDIKPMQSLGYRQLGQVEAGHMTLDQALEDLKRQTKRYAKRQLTWFRKTPDIHWFDPDAEALEGHPSARLNRLIADVRRFLAGDPLALDWEADPP